jgi:CDP-diacylglycerol--serine O-phosphatidyltransferase
MAHDDPEQPDAQGERPVRFEMLRSYTPADLITLANAACGTCSLFICLNYIEMGSKKAFLWPAFLLLPLALFFDVIDGAVARATRRSSPIGADLDSLADIVSFGVAPAVLGFTLGLRGGWDIAILIVFVLCGISRLARFNVTAEALSEGSDTGKVSHFEGTPIPSSLLLVGVLGVAFSMDMVGVADLLGGHVRVGWLFHPLSLLFLLSGSLMISKIRIPKP